MTTNVESKIKSWLFPGLVAVLATIIWQDVKEIKADVKALIAQSNKDMIRIDNLEREMYGKPTSKSSNNNPLPSGPVATELHLFVSVREEELYELAKEYEA